MVAMVKKDQLDRTEIYNVVRVKDMESINLAELPQELLKQAQKVDPLCKMEHCSIDTEQDGWYESSETFYNITIRRPETDEEWENRVALLKIVKDMEREAKRKQRKARKDQEYQEYLRLQAKFEKARSSK